MARLSKLASSGDFIHCYESKKEKEEREKRREERGETRDERRETREERGERRGVWLQVE